MTSDTLSCSVRFAISVELSKALYAIVEMQSVGESNSNWMHLLQTSV